MIQTVKLGGLDMLPTFLKLGRAQLQEAHNQLQQIKTLKHSLHILDNSIIEETITLTVRQNNVTKILLKQCKKWFKEATSRKELVDIIDLENIFQELDMINMQIFFFIKSDLDVGIFKESERKTYRNN